MLIVDKINKTFIVEREETKALNDVSFTVNKGEFFTVVGPSGCGKSTLLRIIAGLMPASSGKISWENEPTLSFVFQNFGLLPYLTARENIAFGLKMKGIPSDQQKKIVEELIGEVGLKEFADKHPKELSGGMKQRVGIARALAINPDVLLLDEPFSALDEFTAEILRKLLHGLWLKRKITVVMITHLIREALELSDQIAVMTQAPGTVEKVFENPLPRPRNMRSPEFFALEDKILSQVKV